MLVLKAPQSGSIEGRTAGRNRFGQYERTRSIPVNPRSAAQGVVRARMSANSAAWRSLTRSNSLGQPYTLQGNQAHASVNNNRLMSGLTVVADAPALSTPSVITGLVVTLTAAAFSLAFTPTPMPAATYLAVYCSPQRSAGRNYEGDFRFMKLSAAAGASPLAILSEYTARFGVPVVGNRIFISCVAITLGFESGSYITSAVVSA
jgi:hypothetical protein